MNMSPKWRLKIPISVAPTRSTELSYYKVFKLLFSIFHTGLQSVEALRVIGPQLPESQKRLLNNRQRIWKATTRNAR